MSSQNQIIYLTKKIEFSSAHRLNSKHLTHEENNKFYGKCTATHGHNYTLKVTFRGVPDPKIGYFINATEVKKSLQTVVKDMDHHSLDDIDYFKENPSTLENLCVLIWERLKGILDQPELLYEVKVKETSNNSGFYRGETK